YPHHMTDRSMVFPLRSPPRHPLPAPPFPYTTLFRSLSDLTRMLLSSPSFSEFLNHMSTNPAPVQQPSPQVQNTQEQAQQQQQQRSEEHTSELQSRFDLVCRLLLEKKTKSINTKVSKY